MNNNGLLTKNNFELVFTLDGNEFQFNCQSINLPTISINQRLKQHRLGQILESSNYQVDQNFNCQVLIHDNFKEFDSINKWMLKLSNPKTGKTTVSAKAGEVDVSLLVKNDKDELLKSFTFESAFPTSISDIDFATTFDSSEIGTMNVSFAFHFMVDDSINYKLIETFK